VKTESREYGAPVFPSKSGMTTGRGSCGASMKQRDFKCIVVKFHPESILSITGKELLRNFCFCKGI